MERPTRRGQSPEPLDGGLPNSFATPPVPYATARSKGNYLSVHYNRIRGRRGPRKAAVAVGHSILVIAYYVLLRNQPYDDLGPTNSWNVSHRTPTKRRLVRQLERLGHQVSLEPLTQSA
jgi:transposase